MYVVFLTFVLNLYQCEKWTFSIVNSEVLDVPNNEEINDKSYVRHYIKQERKVDQFNALWAMAHSLQHSRNYRSGIKTI